MCNTLKFLMDSHLTGNIIFKKVSKVKARDVQRKSLDNISKKLTEDVDIIDLFSKLPEEAKNYINNKFDLQDVNGPAYNLAVKTVSDLCHKHDEARKENKYSGIDWSNPFMVSSDATAWDLQVLNQSFSNENYNNGEYKVSPQQIIEYFEIQQQNKNAAEYYHCSEKQISTLYGYWKEGAFSEEEWDAYLDLFQEGKVQAEKYIARGNKGWNTFISKAIGLGKERINDPSYVGQKKADKYFSANPKKVQDLLKNFVSKGGFDISELGIDASYLMELDDDKIKSVHPVKAGRILNYASSVVASSLFQDNELTEDRDSGDSKEYAGGDFGMLTNNEINNHERDNLLEQVKIFQEAIAQLKKNNLEIQEELKKENNPIKIMKLRNRLAESKAKIPEFIVEINLLWDDIKSLNAEDNTSSTFNISEEMEELFNNN